MPSSGFVRELAAESERWTADGLVTAEQAAAIRARYPPPAPEAESWTTVMLYAAAGVLIGAAAIAFIVVGLDIEDQGAPLAIAAGVLLVAGALAKASRVARLALLSDVLVGGAFVPLAVAGGPRGSLQIPIAIAAVAIPAFVYYARRESPFLPFFAVVAVSVGLGVLFESALDAQLDGAASAGFWLAGQAAVLAGVYASDRYLVQRDSILGAIAAVAGLAVALVVYLIESEGFFNLQSETIEIVLGAVALAILVAASFARHRGFVLGAGAGLGADAIVFAFDVGDVFGGTATLLAIAALLMWQAEFLRGYFRT